MVRRVSFVSLTATLLTLGVGCRHDCGSGWFTSSGGSAPCQLVGRSSDVILDQNGTPIGAGPGTLTPGNSIPLLPSTPLPYPQSNELIPPSSVPVPQAIPTPAPAETSSVLPPPKFGTPVKSTK